jgi:hypothetical protein
VDGSCDTDYDHWTTYLFDCDHKMGLFDFAWQEEMFFSWRLHDITGNTM